MHSIDFKNKRTKGGNIHFKHEIYPIYVRAAAQHIVPMYACSAFKANLSTASLKAESLRARVPY